MKRPILWRAMDENYRLGIALLAAGSSRRFGPEDKLAAQFRGRALGEHAAAALPMERCAQGWVITARPGGVLGHRCETFWRTRFLEPVINQDAETGMGSSVALAARLAKQARCDGLLIALADMPLVPRAHFDALLDSDAPIAVSSNGKVRMPPAMFDATFFDKLKQSSGDKGARDLIKQGHVISCPPEWLRDIDTRDDL